MKILLKYLTLPFIAACMVTIGVAISRYWILDSQHTIFSMEDPASNSGAHTDKGTSYTPQIAPSHKDFVYPTDDTRDPFQQVPIPIAIQQPSRDAHSFIMLTGIIWDEEKPVAIIVDSEDNSYLVRAGEEINKTKVIAIQPRSITIEKEGKTQELALWPAEL